MSVNNEAPTELPPEVVIDLPETLPPEIAEGLAIAQAKATTVESDGYNAHHKYHYPTIAAIACRARQAMDAGGLFLTRISAQLVPMPKWLGNTGAAAMVECRYILGHKSGQRLPIIRVSAPVIPERGRPLDKATAGAITLAHRYLLAGLFNMGWQDPSEDPDQRNDNGGGNRPGKGARHQHRQESQQAYAPPSGPSAFDVQYQQLRQYVGLSLQYLGRYGIDANKAFALATGCDGRAGKGLPASQLLAIIELSRIVDAMRRDGRGVPNSHMQVDSWARGHQVSPFWSGGNLTDRGTKADLAMEQARSLPADQATPMRFAIPEPDVPEVPDSLDSETYPDEAIDDESEAAEDVPEDTAHPPDDWLSDDGDDSHPQTADGTKYDPETGEVLDDSDRDTGKEIENDHDDQPI